MKTVHFWRAQKRSFINQETYPPFQSRSTKKQELPFRWNFLLFFILTLPRSSLQVENLSVCLFVCLFVCLSSLQDFEYRSFISSQDHARPHILYTDGQRMMSAVIWRCQWHTQRQIQRQIHRQRQIQSASKTQCMLYFWRAGGSRISNMTWTWTWRT